MVMTREREEEGRRGRALGKRNSHSDDDMRWRREVVFPISMATTLLLLVVCCAVHLGPLLTAEAQSITMEATSEAEGVGKRLRGGGEIERDATRDDMATRTRSLAVDAVGARKVKKAHRVILSLRHHVGASSSSASSASIGRRLESVQRLTAHGPLVGMLKEPEPETPANTSQASLPTPVPTEKGGAAGAAPRVSSYLRGLPGASFYTVDINIGYPPQTRTLVVDTTISLTWLFCKYGAYGLEVLRAPHEPLDMALSRTMIGISCEDENCTSLFQQSLFGVCFNQTCGYEVAVNGNRSDSTAGVIVRDLVGMLPGVVYNFAPLGCSVSTRGSFLDFTADGVLGLSRSSISLLKVMANTGLPNIMSLCLNGTASGSGVMVFGAPPDVVTSTTPSTPLFGTDAAGYGGSLFMIQMTGRTVGNYTSKVSSTTILSSVTYFTYVPKHEYSTILNEVTSNLGLPNTELTEFYQLACYLQASPKCNFTMFPVITFSFLEGAALDVDPQDYTISYTNTTTCVICVGIRETERNFTTLGATSLQRTWVVHNLETSRILFAKGSCV